MAVLRERRIRLVLLQMTILALAASPAQVLGAASQLPLVDCTVVPGTGVQRALDAASAGSTVVLCPGVHSERVTITKSVVLEGQAGAILDGAQLTGYGAGITIAAGVAGVTVRGLEIRAYRSPNAGVDWSSGIVAAGRSTDVRIESNHIHDNGWVGVLAARGNATAWALTGNRIENHKLAHILFADARDVHIESNRLSGAATTGILLANTQRASVIGNEIHGSGLGAVVLAPAFTGPTWPGQANVQLNAIDGAWRHGIWAAGSAATTIQGNAISGAKSAITLGGDPRETVLTWNTAAPSVEVGDLAPLATGLWGPRAQSTGPVAPVACRRGGASCPRPELDELVRLSLTVSLDPLSDREHAQDLARLRLCEGRDDGCLRTAFIAAGDPLAPRAWSIPVDDRLVGQGELRFVDAAIRGPEEAFASRRIRAPLDQEWTTLVLCRFYPASGAPPQSCAALPRVFDYGLDLNWAASPTSRRVSEWRLALPTDATHASFDRVSSSDATLFVATSRPHTAASPELDLRAPPPEGPDDPLRTVHAGRAVLRCSIVASSDGAASAVLGEPDDCGEPIMLTDNTDAGDLLWCDSRIPWLPDEAHQRLVDEAISGWAWSDTCAPMTSPTVREWEELLAPDDLARLGRAQADWYNATTAAGRRLASDEARAVLTEVVARHLALNVPLQGMPAVTSPTALEGSLPSIRPEDLPGGRAGAAAVWTGTHVLLFGGLNEDRHPSHATEILRYDPASGEIRVMQARLPVGAHGMAAVWTGTSAFLFGGRSASGALATIHRYDPQTDVLVTLPLVSLGAERAFAAAAFDPRDLPSIGCPGGCAYLFGGGDETGPGMAPMDAIVRFNPTTLRLTTLAERLPVPRVQAGAAFVRGAFYVVGGYEWGAGPPRTLADIVRFDPLTGVVETTGALPEGLRQASVVSDGEALYVLGGCAATACPTAATLRYSPSDRATTELGVGLPTPVRSAGGVWTGSAILLHGGHGCPRACDQIVRFLPWANAATVEEVRAQSSDFDVVDLTWGRGARSNVGLSHVEVWDAVRGWARVKEPALIGYTPMRLVVNVTFTELSGLEHRLQAAVLVSTARLPTPPDPLLFEHEGVVYGEAVAWNPANRDYLRAYAPGSARPHAPTLVNVTTLAGQDLGVGVFDVGFRLPAADDAFTVCARSLWTADAAGAQANLVGGLAVENATCAYFDDLAILNARLFSELLVTLELREGDLLGARYELLADPLGNLANLTSGEATHTLQEALASRGADARSARLGHVRLILTIPATASAEERAAVVARLLRAFHATVGVFAIEVDDVPLTRALSHALLDAVMRFGAIVLVGAGELPAESAGWAPEDKLMTITGLAASPLVITVGIGSAAQGVSAASRLGPTPWLGPKPDFVAPGHTAVASVLATLPFVEAVAMRGVRNVDLVRVTLAAFAVPIHDERGIPATFWQQGFGALDLAPFLDLGGLPTGRDLARAVASATGRTEEAVLADAARALARDPAEVAASPAEDVLAPMLPPGALLASVVSALTARVALSTPALPSSLQADFGVVNHDRPGYARLDAIALDPLLNATAQSWRAVLEGAVWTGLPEVDEATSGLLSRLRVEAARTREVDVDVTHYKLEDLLEGDFLYSMQSLLLDDALAGLDPTGDVDALRAALHPWQLPEYHLVHDAPQTVGLDVTVDRSCDPVPVQGVTHAADGILRILRRVSELTVASSGGALRGLDLPTSSSEILAHGAHRYIASQGGQLACLNDVLNMLAALRERTEALRALKETPWGTVDAAERWSGSWDKTDLGRELNATAVALGFDPRDLAADSSALVLDQVLDLLDKIEALLEQKVRLLRVPRIVADAPTGTRLLETIPERTAAAPLGMYVGLARMTTRNVTVHNPLTGEDLVRRDVTIPLPSFLWNNPTLAVDLRYRDGTPLTGMSVALHAAQPRIFDDVEVDHVLARAGIKVNLSVPLGYEVARQADAVRERLAEVEEARARLNATLAASGGAAWPEADPFAPAADRALAAYQATLTGSLAELEMRLTIRAPRGEAEVAAHVTTIITSLVSRLDHQGGVTGATGRATLRNVFPGSYSVFMPYAYPLEADLARAYAPISPGHDALAGPLETPAFALHQWARDTANDLPTHPTAGMGVDTVSATGAPCPPAAPACDRLPWFEVYERLEGPFHQFGLSLTGPDLLAVLCANARDFANATGVNLAYPGCNAPLLDLDANRDAESLLALAHCLLRAVPPELGTPSGDACAGFLAGEDEAIRDAPRDAEAALRAEAYGSITEALANLTRELALLDTAERPVVPWFHSPLRLLRSDPSRFGLSEASVLAASRADNPGVPDDAILDAVRGVLADLRADIQVREPPRSSATTLTEPAALLSRATDLVTGLDWFHLDPAAGDLGDDSVAGQLSLAAGMILDARDRGEVEDFGRFARGLPGLAAAYQEGLASPLTEKAALLAEGWRPRGTVTPGGLALAGAAATPVDPCAAAAGAAGLPPSFAECALVPIERSDPLLRGAGGVDNVQFANQLLEEIRVRDGRYTAADALDMVRRAASLSATGDDAGWVRRTGGIAVEAQNGVPTAGLLLYSMPLPANEYVQYRLEGELLLENTAALVVTTAEPLVVAALTSALATARVPSSFSAPSDGGALGPGLDAALELTGTLDHAVHDALSASAGRHPLLRVDPVGFPVGIEETWSGAGELGRSCLSCGRGLVTARPDGFYNYSRTYEFKTLHRGVDTLYVAIVYFPSLTNVGADEAQATPRQSFGIRDFALQTSTYLGIGAQPSQAAIVTQLGFAPTIEDWKLLYAVPDQPLATAATPGLDVLVEYGDERWANREWAGAPDRLVTAADLVGVGPPGGFASDCADSVAPGYPTAGLARFPRGIPAPGGYLFWAGSDDCDTDEVVALRPRHVRGDGSLYWTTTEPKKRIIDSLQYVTNVPGIDEEMTEAGMMDRSTICNVLCDPLRLLSLVVLAEDRGIVSPTEAAERASDALSLAFTEAAGTAVTAIDVASPLLSTRNVTPFLGRSFLAGAQLTPSPAPRAGPTAHNYLLLDETSARALLAGSGRERDWQAAHRPLTLADRSSPAAAAVVLRPAATGVVGHPLAARDGSEYHSVVHAHGYGAAIEGVGDSQTAQIRIVGTAEAFVGLGTAGAGLAVRIVATEVTRLRDEDAQSFLDGHRWREGASLTVETYALGGALSPQSPCQMVPLYDYVAPYFRCAGVDSLAVYSSAAGTLSASCSTRALEAIAAAQEWALRAANEQPGAAFFVGDGFPAFLGNVIDRGDADAAYGMEAAGRAQSRAAVAAADTRAAAESLRELLGCLSIAGAGATILPQGSILAFAQGATTALDSHLAGARRDALAGAGAALVAISPHVAAHGPGPRTGEARLLSDHGEWVRTNDLRIPVLATEAAAALASVTVRHGPAGSAPSTVLESFDPRAPRGAVVPANARMPAGTGDGAAFWDGTAILVLGGRDAAGRLSDRIVRYDPATDRFETLPARLPTPLAGAAVVTVGDAAFLLGGETPLGLSGQILAFDPRTATTRVVATMPARADAAAVWDGGAVYVLGGRSTIGDTGTILRYVPGRAAAETLDARLPVTLADAAVAWDGGSALVLGGRLAGAPSDAILRFSPRNATAWTIGRLAAPAAEAAAAWTGREALVASASALTRVTPDGAAYGLTSAAPGAPVAVVWTGTLAVVLGADRVLLQGPRAVLGEARLAGADGSAHTLALTSIDARGRALQDAWSFRIDATPPVLTIPQGPADGPTAELVVTLRAVASDATSGLTSVRVEELRGERWILRAQLAVPRGTQSTVAGDLPIDLTSAGDGSVVRLRIVATDVAGNEAVVLRTWNVDRALPTLTGGIVNDVGHLLGEPLLVVGLRVNDPQGLRQVTATLVNEGTGARSTLISLDAGGLVDTGPLAASHAVVFGSRWRLEVEAVDTAGNVNRSVLDHASAQVPPSVKLTEPQYRWQQAAPAVLRVRANVNVPGFAEATPQTTIRVRAPSGALVLERSSTHRGEVLATWDARNLPAGSYEVTVSARAGIFTTMRTATVNVTGPTTGALDVSHYRSYGSLNGTTATELWRLRSTSSSCSLTVTVTSLNGAAVRISLDQSDPKDAGRVALMYDKQSAETSTSTSLTWTNAPAGPYALLVDRTAATDLAYALTSTVKCGAAWTASPALPTTTVTRSG